MCSRKAVEVAKKGKGGWRMFGTWQREIHYARCARGGKERFIRRDNNEMNVGGADATELLSRLRGFGGFCPEVATTKAAVLLSPLAARARRKPPPSFAEIESSAASGPQIEMDHLHFCIPRNDYVTLRALFRAVTHIARCEI